MKKIAFISLITGGTVGVTINIFLSGNTIPNAYNTSEWLNTISAGWFLPSYIFYILLAYLFPLLGFAYISYLYNSKKISLYALLFSIIGTVTVLPTMGFIAYTSTFVSESNIDMMIELYQEAILVNSMYLNILGATTYTIGCSIYGYILFTNQKKLLGILFVFHGLLLSFGFGFYPLLIIGWFLLIPLSTLLKRK